MKNSSISDVWVFSLKWTLIGSVFTAIVLSIIPGTGSWKAGLGVVWGAFLALVSLFMICQMAGSLKKTRQGAKWQASASYGVRYLMYAAGLFLGAWAGLPPLAMLAGILVQKGVLFVYSCQGRKDQDE